MRQTRRTLDRQITVYPFWIKYLDNPYDAAVNATQMAVRKTNIRRQARELRRRVVLPARLRTGVQWSDTCILNISSRGMLIHLARPAPKGSVVELCRGAHMILARVVWRDGAKVGLQSLERLPIEDIVALGQSRARCLGSRDEAPRLQRREPGFPSLLDPRLAPWLQFLGVVGIAVLLALSLLLVARQALARPLELVVATLGSGA